MLQEGLMSFMSILKISVIATYIAVASPQLAAASFGYFSHPSKADSGGVHVRADALRDYARSSVYMVADSADPSSRPGYARRASVSAECALLIPQLTIGAARDGASTDLLDVILRASSSMFPGDHAITESLTDLSAIRGRSLLSHVVLRERLYILGPAAIRDASNNSASVWSALLSHKNRLFVALGFSAPPEETISAIAVRNAISLVDRGQLREALFELTASTPEVQKYLSVWIAEARLRLQYDAAIGVLLTHVIRRCSEAAGN
jgi:hypothetical protein